MYCTKSFILFIRWLGQILTLSIVVPVMLYCILFTSNLYGQKSKISEDRITSKKIPERSGGSYINELTGKASIPFDITKQRQKPGDIQPPIPNVPPLEFTIEGFNFDDNATENSGNVFIPPDPIGAAGTDRVIAVVNVMIEAYLKDGTFLFRDALADFFAPLAPLTFTFDPKVIYDQYEDRFLVVTLERVDAGVNPSPDNQSRILLAVSKTGAPATATASDWEYHAIDAETTIGAIDHWADYPGFAVDEEAVYITANMFAHEGAATIFGVRLWIVDKGVAGGFYDGFPAIVTVYDPYAEVGLPGFATTTMPAHVFGPGGVNPVPPGIGTFLVSYSSFTTGGPGGTESVQVVRVDDPLGTPVFTQEFVNVGDIEDVGGTYGFPDLPDAPQNGSADSIEVNDTRALDCVWRDDALWLTTTILPNSGSDAGQTTAHWFKLNTSAVILPSPGPIIWDDQGDVGGEDIADNTFTFFPSIAVNSVGDMKIGFAASAPTIFAGAYYTGRQPGDPAGTVQPSGVLRAGLDVYVRTFDSDRNRWGDYSGASVDPDDTFWIFNQYALERGSGTPPEDGRWGTAFGKCFTPQSGANIELTPRDIDFGTVAIGGNSDTVTVSIINTGDTEFDVSDIYFPDEADIPFILQDIPQLPVTLSRFEFITFQVFYAPWWMHLGESNSTITVQSTAGNSVVSLTGFGEIQLAQSNVCYASTGFTNPDNSLSTVSHGTNPQAIIGGLLLTINTVTGAGTEVGPTNLFALPGLAINSIGEIFGVDDGYLYRLDATTGMAVPINDNQNGGFGIIEAIAFDENNILYGISVNPLDFELVTIDTATGDTTHVGPTGKNILGLAFDTRTGILWGISPDFNTSASTGAITGSLGSYVGDATDSIYTIDKLTGAVTLVGMTGLDGMISDIHFDDTGNLYGVMNGILSDTLISINKTTGAGTVIGDIGFSEVSGLAFRNTFRIACEPLPCDAPAIFPTPADGEMGEIIKGFNTGSGKDTVCIDIQIKENPNEIDAFGFTVHVDPNQLTFVGASAGDLTVDFVGIDAQETPPGSGTIVCGGFGTAPIPINSTGALIRLCFLISSIEDDSSEITISDLKDDIVDFTACCNYFDISVCPHDGDVNEDGQLTPGDALCAFQIFLNDQNLPPNCEVEDSNCEVITADVNCNDTVTPQDALDIFQRFLANLPPEDCFAQTASPLAKFGSPAGSYSLSLNQRSILQSNNAGQKDRLKVALVVDNPEGLDAFGLNIAYPADKLEFVGIERTSLTTDWIQLDGLSNEPGVITIGGFNIEPIASSTSGDLFQLVFKSIGAITDQNNIIITHLIDDFGKATVQSTETEFTFVPKEFALHQNYPNPFNPETQIRFDIPAVNSDKVNVRISIYNITGQLVRILLNEKRSSGSYEIQWDGRNASGIQVPSGMYFYSISAGDFKDTKKMLLLR